MLLEYVKIAIELLMNWRFWVLIFPVPVGGLAILIAMLSEKIKEVATW